MGSGAGGTDGRWPHWAATPEPPSSPPSPCLPSRPQWKREPWSPLPGRRLDPRQRLCGRPRSLRFMVILLARSCSRMASSWWPSDRGMGGSETPTHGCARIHSPRHTDTWAFTHSSTVGSPRDMSACSHARVHTQTHRCMSRKPSQGRPCSRCPSSSHRGQCLPGSQWASASGRMWLGWEGF